MEVIAMLDEYFAFLAPSVLDAYHKQILVLKVSISSDTYYIAEARGLAGSGSRNDEGDHSCRLALHSRVLPFSPWPFDTGGELAASNMAPSWPRMPCLYKYAGDREYCLAMHVPGKARRSPNINVIFHFAATGCATSRRWPISSEDMAHHRAAARDAR